MSFSQSPRIWNRVKPSLTGGAGARAHEPRRLRQHREPTGAEGRGRRAGERPERAARDRSLDAVEQQGVVHDADAALDVVERRAGEPAPGERRGQVSERRPRVDRDRAVAQVGDRALEAVAERRLRRRVDEHVGAERAGEPLVGVRDGGVEELLPVAGQRHDAEHGREVLRRLERGGVAARGDLDDRAGSLGEPRRRRDSRMPPPRASRRSGGTRPSAAARPRRPCAGRRGRHRAAPSPS